MSLTKNATHTFTGLTINGGTVSLTQNNYLDNVLALTVNSGGTLQSANKMSQTVGPLNGAGTIYLTNGTLSVNGAAGHSPGPTPAATHRLLATVVAARSFSGFGTPTRAETNIYNGTLSVGSLDYVNSGNWANHNVWSNLGLANSGGGTILMGSGARRASLPIPAPVKRPTARSASTAPPAARFSMRRAPAF